MRTRSRGRCGRVWSTCFRQSECPPTLGVQALPSGCRAAMSACERLNVRSGGPVQSAASPQSARDRPWPLIGASDRRNESEPAVWSSRPLSGTPLSNRLADDAQPRVTSVVIAARRAPRGGTTDLPVGAVVWDDGRWIVGIRRRRPVDYGEFPPPPPDPGNESNGMRCHGRTSKSSDPPLKPSNAGLPL
jgi:hypothetical protein